MRRNVLKLSVAVVLAAGGVASAQSLTTLPPNNGSGGVFMDLMPLSGPIDITMFETPVSGSVGSQVSVEVWVRPGSYVGFDGDPTGWTLHETVVTTAQGTTVNASMVLANPIPLADGVTTAVYLHAITTGGGIRYQGTGSTATTNFSNAELQMFTDVARTGVTPFGGTRFSPRAFAGTIHYQPGGPPIPGACCFSDGTCQNLLGVDCFTQGGSFQGGGTDCSTANCPQPGACCYPSGACEFILESACTGGGGTWSGAAVTCAQANCPQPPTGACCLPSGTCEVIWEPGCLEQNGIYYGDGTDCTGRECPFVQIFPNLPHAASNTFPFNQTPGTNMHQVFASSLFSNLSGGAPVLIERIAFAPTSTATFNGEVNLRLGYTNVIPGVGSASGGLAIPDLGGGGGPNATGPMHDFFSGPVVFAATANAEDFSFSFTGAPFEYDPSQGNLLLEIYMPVITTGISSSRAAGGPEASRAYHRANGTSGELPTQAGRTEFSFSLAAAGCYPNCDGSTVEPILNVDDFTCFVNEFAAAQTLPHEQQITSYPNCDGSTVAPVLNVDDFTCFINSFAQGCR